MSTSVLKPHVAHRMEPLEREELEVLGPVVEFLTPFSEDESEPCAMRGTIPPGGIVPLHSHLEPETFIQISGEMEGLVWSDDGFEWVRIRPGDVFHVPCGARHAFRNPSSEPAVSIVVTKPRIARFFREVGTVRTLGVSATRPPAEAMLRHFLEVSGRYGYWNGTPQENAEVGLSLIPG